MIEDLSQEDKNKVKELHFSASKISHQEVYEDIDEETNQIDKAFNANALSF